MSSSVLSIGIVGLPNVGKSTLFNALLKRQTALAANYPFATIEPNIGVVDVPDPRLEHLAQFVRNDYGARQGDKDLPEKITLAVIKFYDIAGLVKGASQGEGLGNEFLGHIRDVDAIVQVVRAFNDENIIRSGSITPKDDIETINTELILADLQSLEKKIEKMGNTYKFPKSKEDTLKSTYYAKIRQALNAGNFVSTLNLDEEGREVVRELNFLTLKPVIYVFNVDEQELNKPNTHSEVIKQYDGITISAKIESELSILSKTEQEQFLKELNIVESGLDQVIKKGYQLLGLETFLTMGPKEVRAWTYTKGAKAPEAAGVIHTDFQRGFISAEIIAYTTILSIASLKKAKELGKVRLEGKNYVMQDGDIVEFRFSV
jgi:GTP-binding protein YchF